MVIYWIDLDYPFLSSVIFPFLCFLTICWYCGLGSLDRDVCISLTLSLALPTSFDNNNNIDAVAGVVVLAGVAYVAGMASVAGKVSVTVCSLCWCDWCVRLVCSW